MIDLGREKSQQALASVDADELWIFVTESGSDPAVSLIFDLNTVGKSAFMLHADHGRLALIANFDEGHVAGRGLFEEVRSYDQSFDDALAMWIDELKPARVLLNYSQGDHLCDGLRHGQFLGLTELFSRTAVGCVIESSESKLVAVRANKSAEELRRLCLAIEGSEALYDRLRSQLHVGQSEREIQTMMLAIAADLELEPDLGEFGGPLVLINRVGMAHRAPTSSRLVEGDVLVLDHGLTYQGYCSDVARTLYFCRPGETEAPSELRRAFNSVYEAITAAFETIKPGRLGWEVDAAARAVHHKNGYPEMSHATGHQIGRAMHDGGGLFAPKWDRYGTSGYVPIEAGQVFTLEPTILQTAMPSVLVEENVVVTADGARWLTHRQESIWCIG